MWLRFHDVLLDMFRLISVQWHPTAVSRQPHEFSEERPEQPVTAPVEDKIRLPRRADAVPTLPVRCQPAGCG